MRQFMLCGFLASLVALATPGVGYHAVPPAARAQEPAPKADVTPPRLAIGGELRYEPYRIVRLNAQGVPEKAGRKWKVTPLDDPKAVVDWATGRNVVRAEWVAPPGRYLVTLTVGWLGQDGTFNLDEAEATVTVGVPPAPTPPGPQPAPTPPGPAPPPQPVGPLRVILVYERNSGMSRAQENFLNSTKIRAYLDAHCAKNAGGHPEYALFDDDVEITRLSPTMSSLWGAVKPKATTLPAMAIAAGTSVDIYPIPADATEAWGLDLLRKYGGN